MGLSYRDDQNNSGGGISTWKAVTGLARKASPEGRGFKENPRGAVICDRPTPSATALKLQCASKAPGGALNTRARVSELVSDGVDPGAMLEETPTKQTGEGCLGCHFHWATSDPDSCPFTRS